MKNLQYTSIKNNKILIKSGDENRSSWRKLLTAEDGTMSVKYKKHMFNVNTEEKTLVAIGEVDSSVFLVKRRVIKSRWTKTQQETIDNGMTLVLDGVDYSAKDGQKICKCCNESLSIDNFAKKMATKDKLQPKCRKCDANSKKYRKLLKVA